MVPQWQSRGDQLYQCSTLPRTFGRPAAQVFIHYTDTSREMQPEADCDIHGENRKLIQEILSDDAITLRC